MQRSDGRRWMRVALGGMAAVVILLIAAQLALPRLAASKISSRVGRYGKVQSVSVSAWPAVKMLWGDVDSVHVRAGHLAMSTAQAGKLLWEGHGVRDMDMRASSVKVGPLEVDGAVLKKHGSEMSAEARTSEAQVKAALPEGLEMKLLKSGGGQVEVQASGGLFGVQASVDAVAQAREGRLIAHPLGFLIEGFRLNLFSEPHVYVEGVGASAEGSDAGTTYRLRMMASLR